MEEINLQQELYDLSRHTYNEKFVIDEITTELKKQAKRGFTSYIAKVKFDHYYQIQDYFKNQGLGIYISHISSYITELHLTW